MDPGSDQFTEKGTLLTNHYAITVRPPFQHASTQKGKSSTVPSPARGNVASGNSAYSAATKDKIWNIRHEQDELNWTLHPEVENSMFSI